LLITISIIILMIFINAFYVLAEFATVGVKKWQIKQLADEGNRFAIYLLPVIEDNRKTDRYISICQIGITLSSIIVGALSQAKITPVLTHALIKYGDSRESVALSISVIAVLMFFAIAQMLFGEIIPKTIALQYPTACSVYTVLPMKWSEFLFSWFIYILNGSGILILKLLRVPLTGHRHIHSPEEIEMIIKKSYKGGFLETYEHNRLSKALKITGITARELMIARNYISAIPFDMPVEKVLHEIKKSPYTKLPVYRETIDNISGILHTKELVNRYINGEKIHTIEEILKPAIFIPETMKIDRLINIFRKEHFQQAIVIDEYGGTAGLITMEDVLVELLGNVADEFKHNIKKPEKLTDGTIRLPGIIKIGELETLIERPLKGNAITAGGYIIDFLGRFPQEGECLNIEGVEFKIEKVSKNKILSLIIKPCFSEQKDVIE